MDSVRTKKLRTCPTVGSSLVSVINQLQEIMAPLGRDTSERISLPQVAVVGSQSSGKSSVLEALVGRDFLPRGCDICTRRPLVLLLENRDENGEEWGEFEHLPGERFRDFNKIRREIQAETERGAGLNKGVSDKKIILRVYSPNVLNMTLVDLPGITKVPVGDQPKDIEVRIRKMIMSYIKHENCIILAVSPGNADLATSDALQIAKEADPTGYRTIGVITKLDIMDRGTNARNFLLGKVVPLRLGYFGVINRSQEEINKNCSIADALCNEEKFFRDHPVYNGLSECCGIPQLAKGLNQILECHIRKILPSLKSKLKSEMNAIVRELRKYGGTIDTNVDKGGILLNLLTKYCEAFSAMVDGSSQDILAKELLGGARIHFIFQTTFVKSLEEVDPCEDLTDDDIRMAIQNAAGIKNSLFVPEAPFEVLVKIQISRLLEPSLQCLQYIYNELIKISHACEATDELIRFPVLRKKINETMVRVLRDGVEPAYRMISDLIEMEKGHINTAHPNFLSGSKAVEVAVRHRSSQQVQDNTDVEKESVMDRARSTEVEKESVMDRARSTAVEKESVMDRARSYPSLTKRALNAALGIQGSLPPQDNEKSLLSGGNASTRNWGILKIFGSKGPSVEKQSSSRFLGKPPDSEKMPSTIKLREPPPMLRPLETTDNETLAILVTKLLLESYYDIVRKNIQDLVPKAIMHFLINHAKRKLQKVLLQELYRSDLYDVLLEEEAEMSIRRKHNQELLLVLQKGIEMLEEVGCGISAQSSHFDFAIEDDRWFE